MDGWESPRLKVRFDLTGPELQIFTETGVRFLTFSENAQRGARGEQRAEREEQRAEREQQRAEREQQRAEREQQRAEQERQLKEQAEAKIKMLYLRLQELGIDPEQL